METKTEEKLMTKSTKPVQILEIEMIGKKESEGKQIPFREAVKGFWEKFDSIYGTNLAHEKIQDYDYRNRT